MWEFASRSGNISFLYFPWTNRFLLPTNILLKLSLVHQVTTSHDCQENVNLCESFSSSWRMSDFAAIINKWLVGAKMTLTKILIAVRPFEYLLNRKWNEVNFNNGSSTTLVRDIINNFVTVIVRIMFSANVWGINNYSSFSSLVCCRLSGNGSQIAELVMAK